MKYLGAGGTLIHEKNLKSKISCQTPFKTHSLASHWLEDLQILSQRAGKNDPNNANLIC
jgi:hypothetical protein